jgi:hypothetical protein
VIVILAKATICVPDPACEPGSVAGHPEKGGIEMLRTLLLAAAAVVGIGAGSAARALTYDFSFTNPFPDDNGLSGVVTGRIQGLTDNATGPASSVQVLSGGGATGEYVSGGTTGTNTFTLLDGNVTAFDFLSFGVENTAPGATCCSITIFTDPEGAVGAGLSTLPTTVYFAPVPDFTLAPVPLPAPLLPLMAALGALVGLGWKRRRAPFAG